MKEEELEKRILEKAEFFKKRAQKSHSEDTRHDPVLKDEGKEYYTAYDKLGWSYAKIGSIFNRDSRTVEKVVKSYKPVGRTIKQKSYEETPHKRKMRKLARALSESIKLPSIWDKDLLPDLPVEFKPGKYFLSIGTVEIAQNGQIKVNYHDIGALNAETHLTNGLSSHLSTSGLSKFERIIGDKGNLVAEVEQYSQSIVEFLKPIIDEVKTYRAKLYFSDEQNPGLTKWFIITAWKDAIIQAGGHFWIDDTWYHPFEVNTPTNLLQLKCGAYIIGITRCNKTLKTYENWHKKLRVKCARSPLAKDIAAKEQEMNELAQGIKQRFEEFSDIERLPGHCDLCRN